MKLNLRELATGSRKAEDFKRGTLWNSTTTGRATTIPSLTDQRAQSNVTRDTEASVLFLDAFTLLQAAR